MSWHTVTLTDTTAGRLIELFDSILVLNSHWTIYDSAAGTNCKTYRCHNGVIDFYIKVNNNYSGYAVIEGWEGWDSVTHAGVGQSIIYSATNAAYYLRFYFAVDCCIRLTDNNFHLISPSLKCHYFIGGLDESFDDTKNIVLFVTRSTDTGSHNPFGSGYTNSNAVSCKLLFDEMGVSHSLAKFRTHVCFKTIDGNAVFSSKVCVYNEDNKQILGYIYNAASMMSADYSTLADGDTLTVGSETWGVIKCTAGKKATSLYRIGE